ncbi:MAG: hypothetical protein ACYC96_12755 [Fimbriimonadaceae bacterium]
MSAISIPSSVDLEVPVRQRPAVVGLPGGVLFPPSPVRSRNRARVRATNVLASVLLNGIVLASFGIGTYVVSGFAGNVGLEAANRQALQSIDRANAATLSESGLRRRVDNLSLDETVGRWAKFHGYQSTYKPASAPGKLPRK